MRMYLRRPKFLFLRLPLPKKEKCASRCWPMSKWARPVLIEGRGPVYFFYKHRLENRRSRLLLIDTTTLIWASISIVFAVFMHDGGIVPVFIFATYLQVFSSSMGRWLRELTLPYVYMLPISPFRKLIGICRENIYKAAVEAFIVMVPVGLILGASPVIISFCVVARFSFSLLFMAGHILSERIFGQIISKALIIGLFIITMLVIALPGIIIGVLLGTFVNITAAMGSIILWNLIAAVVVTYLCRDILNYAELNNR